MKKNNKVKRANFSKKERDEAIFKFASKQGAVTFFAALKTIQKEKKLPKFLKQQVIKLTYENNYSGQFKKHYNALQSAYAYRSFYPNNFETLVNPFSSQCLFECIHIANKELQWLIDSRKEGLIEDYNCGYKHEHYTYDELKKQLKDFCKELEKIIKLRIKNSNGNNSEAEKENNSSNVAAENTEGNSFSYRIM